MYMHIHDMYMYTAENTRAQRELPEERTAADGVVNVGLLQFAGEGNLLQRHVLRRFVRLRDVDAQLRNADRRQQARGFVDLKHVQHEVQI